MHRKPVQGASRDVALLQNGGSLHLVREVNWAAMYCPECGLEYREGVTTCTDCGIALTVDPPAPPQPAAEWVDLETVLETSNPAILLVSQSLLKAEGIPSYARGEMLQELLGMGRLPSGSNNLFGPVRLEVPRDRSEEARELLKAASESISEATIDSWLGNLRRDRDSM